MCDSFPAITTRISRWGQGRIVEDAMLPRTNAALLLGKRQLRALLWNILLDTGLPVIDFTLLGEVHRQNGRIVLRTAVAPAASAIISTRFAIDATGRASVLAQKLGVRRRVLDTLVSFWLSGEADSWPSHAIAVATVRDGWLFCAGSKLEKAAIGFFTAGSHLRERPTADGILDRALSVPAIAELIGARPEWHASSVVTRNAATTLLATSGGEDWLACGDALQTVDPIASNGNYLALKQGLLAASVARETLRGDRQALQSYEIATRRQFKEILAQRNAYYGLFRSAVGRGGGDAVAW